MPTTCITVRRSIEDGLYTYYVGEAYSPGQVYKVFLWRTLDGYFGEITLDGYNHWGILKNDLMICLHKELQCPEFDEDSPLRPPLFRQYQDFR
jgi:hypothetical protein